MVNGYIVRGHRDYVLEYSGTAQTGTPVQGNYDLVKGAIVENYGTGVQEDIVEPVRNENGFTSGSLLDHYYNQIHLTPLTVDFGVITSALNRQITVWNSYFEGVDLESMTYLDLSGSGISSSQPLPLTFKPLQEIDISIDASTEGVTAFQGDILFEFSEGSERSLAVGGIRSLLWDVWMNWRQGFKETHEFLTKVTSSFSGKEHRESYRQNSRLSIQFSALGTDDISRKLHRVFSTKYKISQVVPEFNRWVEMDSSIPVTGIFTLSEVPYWMEAGKLVILRYGNEMLLKYIDEVTGSDVTLREGLAEEWPAGTRVYPGLICKMPDKTQVSRHARHLNEVRLSFEVSPGENPQLIAPTFDTYDDLPIIDFTRNWASTQSEEYNIVSANLDFDTGVTAKKYFQDYMEYIPKFTITGLNQEQVDETVSKFYFLRGRLKAFLTPDFSYERLKVVADISSSDTQIRVEGTDIEEYLSGSLTYKVVRLTTTGGSTIIKTVTSMETVSDVSGDDTLLKFGTSVGSNILVGEIAKMEWLLKCRMGSDKLIVDWATAGVANMTISMKVLPYV